MAFPPTVLQLFSASCTITFSKVRREDYVGEEEDVCGMKCAYMWHTCMCMWTLCQSGALAARHRNHLADVNRKEYWAGHRIARRADEPGLEEVCIMSQTVLGTLAPASKHSRPLHRILP